MSKLFEIGRGRWVRKTKCEPCGEYTVLTIWCVGKKNHKHWVCSRCWAILRATIKKGRGIRCPRKLTDADAALIALATDEH